jgi:hypothetical protein
VYLIRLLILKATREVNDLPQPIQVGDVVVNAQEFREEKARLLLNARVHLAALPVKDDAGCMVVPQSECHAAEEALVTFANFFSATTRTGRSLTSPVPYLLFEAETDHEEELLETSSGISCGFCSVPRLLPRISLDDEMLQALSDRSEGVTFIANAQSEGVVTGAFREYVRLFEAAFDTDKMAVLRRNLYSFLAGAQQLGYTEDEVHRWLDDFRHAVVHTRGKSGHVTELDLMPYIQRVEQAAYDVLFNKKDWRTQSYDRREVWTPDFGTTDQNNSVFITQGRAATLQFSIVDSLAGFPVILNDHIPVEPPLFGRLAPDSEPTNHEESGELSKANGDIAEAT